MKTHTRSMSRLLGRLLLLVGLLTGLGLLASRAATPAHAATTTITTCDETTLDNAISSATSGDTLSFGCSGDIKLTSTLNISKDLTLDGNGQSVTLDGGSNTQVLSVHAGVNFTLNALTVADGYSDLGGGLYNCGGTVTITNSTFSGNKAPLLAFGGRGGGLYNDRCNGIVTITNSTFYNNFAEFFGGGLYNDGATMTITNSTIAHNISNNLTGSGIANVSLGTMSIGGSIVANIGNNCYVDFANITNLGYNLDSDGSCFFGAAVNPLLDPNGLQSNGGPTQTIALQQGSPAIDQIPAAQCPTTDQRGVTRPDNGESACDMGAYEFQDDADLGLKNLPSNITVDTTSPQGAVVTYTQPTATDESGDSSTASVSCTPASGSTFAIGTTTVTCTATDSDDANSPVSQSFIVTVNDTDLGLKNLPANMTLNATSPQGAVVTYMQPTVVDEDSPLPIVNCSPTSGSTFAIGTTTVTCTVTDTDDTPSSVSQSFTVTVLSAAAQVSNLITTVNGMGLSKSLQTALDNKLQDVLTAINGGQTATACSDLTDFIGFVQSHTGKGISQTQAKQLIAAAKQIQAVMGC